MNTQLSICDVVLETGIQLQMGDGPLDASASASAAPRIRRLPGRLLKEL